MSSKRRRREDDDEDRPGASAAQVHADQARSVLTPCRLLRHELLRVSQLLHAPRRLVTARPCLQAASMVDGANELSASMRALNAKYYECASVFGRRAVSATCMQVYTTHLRCCTICDRARLQAALAGGTPFVHAVTSEFAYRWIREQHTNAPAALWTTAAQDYINYAQDILEKYRGTIEQLSGGALGALRHKAARRAVAMLYAASRLMRSLVVPSTHAAVRVAAMQLSV